MEARGDQRTKRRIACEIHAGSRTVKGMVVDLSASGLFVQTNAAPLRQHEGDVEVHLLGGSGFPELTLRAVIARRQLIPAVLGSILGRGVGLRIVEAPDEYHDALLRLREGRRPEQEEEETPAPDETTETAPSEDAAPEAAVEEGARPGGEIVPATDAPPRTGPAPVPDRYAMIVDEGELNDVYEQLEELGARPVRARLTGPTRFEGWERPPRVFVAAARAALSIRVPEAAPLQGVVTIAVAEAESQTLCALMRRLGYQYVVRRPVHPEALRLLLMRALYRDENERSEPRFAFGEEVFWWAGWRGRRGSMLDISPGGCRLVSPVRENLGQPVSIRVPRAATGGTALWIRARVLRCYRLEGDGEGGPYSLALTFDDERPRVQARLGALLARQSIGPSTLHAGWLPAWARELLGRAGLLRDAATERRLADSDSPEERRRHPRGALRQELVALDDETEQVVHVLLGRDLSPGGIRIEPHPDIGFGDELRLALYDASLPNPLMLDAEVIRDDGDNGLALQFHKLKRKHQRQIEQIVANLPSVESLSPIHGQSQGVVVAQIVSRLARDA